MGLTGNVASGKSTVARLWEAEGVPVVSADRLAREVVAPGTEGLARLVEAFGAGILDEKYALDRRTLGALVFEDEEARKRLESILHPLIGARRARWLRRQREAGRRLVVSEIPLLFETGMEGEFDVVVFVDAPEGVRRRRLEEDRGLSPVEARRLLAAQDPPGPKRAAAHHVLRNDGSLEDLRRRAQDLLRRLEAEE